MMTSPLRTARRLVAAAVFAVTLLAFLDFREMLPAAASAAAARVQFVPSLLRALSGAGAAALVTWLALTLLFGRIYCSSVCPLGILQDIVWRLRQKISPVRLRHEPPHTRIRIAFVAAALVPAAAGLWLVLALLDPYSIFGRMAATLLRPAVLAMNNLLVAIAGTSHGLYRVDLPPAQAASLAVALGSLGIIAFMAAGRGRLFCNTLCPVGGVLGLLSSRSVFRLRIDKSACEKCGDCLASCKAQCIDLKNQEIDFSRCVACYNCVSVCDRQGIAYRATPRSSRASHPGAPGDPTLRRNLARLAATATALLLPARIFAKHDEEREDHDDHEGRAEHGEHHGRESEHGPIMPPGALSQERFLDRCTSCGLCISNCPTHVLQPSFLEYGWRGILKPHLDPSIGYCNFDCTICTEICPTGALSPLSVETKKRTQCGEARFHKKHCIVYTDGTDCAACSEHCPTKAVDTRPFRGDLLLPEVNEDLCIGCGACEFACPVRPERAIRVSGRPLQTTLAPARRDVPPPEAKAPAKDFPF